MALTSCSHCGAKVSDKAHTCPKCGSVLGFASIETSLSSSTPSEATSVQSTPIKPPVSSASSLKQPPVQSPRTSTHRPEMTNVQRDNIEPIMQPLRAEREFAPLTSRGCNTTMRNVLIIVGTLVVCVCVAVMIFSSISNSRSEARHIEAIAEDVERDVLAENPPQETSLTNKNGGFVSDICVYTFADNTWLRSSKVKGVEYNKVALLKFGTQMTVIGVASNAEWTYVKVVEGPYADSQGYVATDFLMNSPDFTCLQNNFTSSQLSTLKMGKYRVAAIIPMQTVPELRYRRMAGERILSDRVAILLEYLTSVGSSHYFLFCFQKNGESIICYSDFEDEEMLSIDDALMRMPK